MRVLVLTTSYPRHENDVVGRFVADAADAARAGGVDVDVVSPASFAHHGIAYGHGIVGNLRSRPWLAAALPSMLWRFRRVAARAAIAADLVHAHWLLSGAVAMTLRVPYVVQVWGTDVELAARAPWIARPILAQAQLAIAASTSLAEAALRLGARDVRVVPSPIAVPPQVVAPHDPPHVLYAGRLSREKGVLEFLEATAGMPRVLVGDGPLRPSVPEAVGFVPHDRLGAFYDRAAVVAIPSHREGFGVVCREAMAHGRAVVASATGGLVDAVVDGETGLLVPPRDVEALREAVARLLADEALRQRLGRAARDSVEQDLSVLAVTRALLAAYRDAVSGA